MSVTYSTRTTANPLSGAMARTTARFSAWREARATRKALSMLSDRALEDIGLTRGDIKSFAARR